MPGDSSSEQEPDESDSEFVEVDPTGRYGRYREVLGKGAFKTVYKAFDELEGMEVAWNQVRVADLLRNAEDLERLYSEVHLLKTLNHQNIIKLYNSWLDTKHDNINFVTEIFTSGTLRQYRKKHKHVDKRALKNWSRQILRGLLYLHSHDPPVIHRDLKCDNIFVNGNHGEVKIGDLGLAAILRNAHSAHSVIGTPEFMAPELYEEEYNELVDIYAFGMCLMELVTFEYPYCECANAAQIYKKVTLGIKPASLGKVKDAGVKVFIEKCIASASERLSARELLMDPFLQSDGESESTGHSLRPNVSHSDNNFGQTDAESDDLNAKEDPLMASRDFIVEGQRKDITTIFLKLHINDSTGHPHNIHFPFDIEADTSISVASEMVAELDLTDQDVTTIAAMIDSEIQSHVPEWMPGEPFLDRYGNDKTTLDYCDSEIKDEVSALPADSDHSSGTLVLERLPSGRKFWSDSPKGISGDSPARLSKSHPFDLNLHDNNRNSADIDDDENFHLNHGKELGYSPNDLSSPNQLKGSPLLTERGENNVITVDLSASSEVPNASPLDPVNDEAKEVSLCTDDQSGDIQNEPVSDQQTDSNAYLLSDDKTLLENEQDVKIAVEMLEHLLLEQQKELRELKQKHDVAIADILKALPPELHDRTLNMCRMKVAGFRMHSDIDADAGHS